MRWLAFAIVSALVLIAQVSMGPRMTFGGARPDWLITIVVLVALNAKRSDSAMAAWCLGFAADLLTMERAGLLALSYLLVAVCVGSVQDYFFRYHRLALAILVIVASFCVRLVWLAYRFALYGAATGSLANALFIDCLWSAFYTGLWAIVLHWLFGPALSFGDVRQPRYRYASMTRA